jgi:calcineurin-like phosphoesterase family protein
MEPPRTYIISDLHLEHANIIRYCNRQFDDVHQMNSEILLRWNQIVGKYDTIYYLGDLVFSRSKGSNIAGWMHKLNGIKVNIWGNHDRFLKCKLPYLVINFNGESILLVHSPNPNDRHNQETLAHTGICQLLKEWRETSNWIIHGHYHNNNLQQHPLINNEDRMINVSAELLDYRPIELEKLLAQRKKS